MALSECNTTTNSKQRELVAHGTIEFPIACYHDDLSSDIVPWHWHDELEAIIVSEGQAVVAAGHNKYLLNKGDGLFINSGVLHAAWNSQNNKCRFHSVVFHPRLIGGNADSIFFKKYINPLTTNTAFECLLLDKDNKNHKDSINDIECAWQACLFEEPWYEFEVRESLSKLIYTLSTNTNIPSENSSEKSLRDSDRIKDMIEYIHAHYSEDITISQISQSASISVSECLRCFHNTIGTTPIQYVKEFRMKKASELLITTTNKIIDIGTQCGFQEMSYFSKSFKNIYGCTPSEYRTKNRSY